MVLLRLNTCQMKNSGWCRIMRYLSKTNLLMIVLLFVVIIANKSFGQNVSIDLDKVEATEGNTLVLGGSYIANYQLTDMKLFYKSSNDSEYKVATTTFFRESFKAIIPEADVKYPLLEYYVVCYGGDKPEYYPENFTITGDPALITVKAKSEYHDKIILLSPTENEIVADNKLFFSISLLRLPDNVDKSATKLYINGSDVTKHCLKLEDLINYNEILDLNLNQAGPISMEVKIYDNDGNFLYSRKKEFRIIASDLRKISEDKFNQRTFIVVEGRNEYYNQENTWYNNASVDFSGSYQKFGFDGRVYVTSEEKGYLQPYNRYSLKVSHEYGAIELGDHYPVYPNTIYGGKRIRGISAHLDLGVFNLSASYGSITRAIEGELLEIYAVDDETPLEPGLIRIDSTKYGSNYGRVSFGTYSRNIFIVRPEFVIFSNYKFALNYLHSSDEPNSIDFGVQPKENLVIGPELELKFDRNRINFRSSAFVSLQNSDISKGTVEDTSIINFLEDNDFADVDPYDIIDAKNILSNFITVNPHIGPFNITELASLASDAELRAKYYNNRASVKYVYRGNDYNSFGQPYLRKDIEGFKIADRISLLNNKVFFNLGFERLHDNLQGTKLATTKTKNISVSGSYFPRNELPDIVVGFYRSENWNGISLADTTKRDLMVEQTTSRFYINSSYDFYLPIKHKLDVQFSFTDRADASYRNNDSRGYNFAMNFSSDWSKRFRTATGFANSISELINSNINYTRLFVSGTLFMFDRKLDMNLRVSPTFGYFSRMSVEFFGGYKFFPNLSLQYQLRYFSDFSEFGNMIAGMKVQYTL